MAFALRKLESKASENWRKRIIIIQGAVEVTPFLLFEFSSFCLISSLF